MQGNQPIQYALRALTETVKRYSQIEKEMLSIIYGLCYYRCARISCLQCNHVFLKPDSLYVCHFGSVHVEL